MVACGGLWWLVVTVGGLCGLLVACGDCWWLVVTGGGLWWISVVYD